MNITYLIGNGFDVNIGLKSRYVDFYRYYVNQHAADEPDVINRFKEGINKYIQDETQKEELESIDWRDLEVALGQFTDKIDEAEGEALYLDINDSLKQYLTDEYRYFDADAFTRDDFYNYLTDPITKHFNRVTVNNIKNYLASFSGNDNIYVINFNYTRTIEDLAGFDGSPLPIGLSVSGRQAQLNAVYHIHQTLADDEVLVGVNDVSQIANKKFHDNRFLCNLFIKPRTNSLLGTGINQDCESVIAHTDLFILFGTSAGITDRKWWKSVCNRLVNSNARLIVFVHCPQKRPHMNLYMEDMRDEVIRKLFESAGTKVDTVFEKIIERCFVSFSETMFKMPVTYNSRIKQEKTYRLGTSEVTMKVLDMGMRHVAVGVEAAGEESGVPAEGMWLKDFFPGYTHSSQHLIPSNGEKKDASFDLLPIQNKTKRKDIYFEISSFLGKNNNFPMKGVSTQKKIDALKSLLK